MATAGGPLKRSCHELPCCWTSCAPAGVRLRSLCSLCSRGGHWLLRHQQPPARCVPKGGCPAGSTVPCRVAAELCCTPPPTSGTPPQLVAVRPGLAACVQLLRRRGRTDRHWCTHGGTSGAQRAGPARAGDGGGRTTVANPHAPASANLALITAFFARRGMSIFWFVSVKRLKLSTWRMESGESTRACVGSVAR